MSIHWGFQNLGGGIAVAIGVGSKVIPDLMESYPEIMRAFFFGLVLASISVPYRLMQRRGALEAGSLVAFALAAFVLVGLSTNHAASWDLVTVSGTGETVEDLAMSVPSSVTPSQLLAMDENQVVLEEIAAAQGENPAGPGDGKRFG